MVEKRIRSVVKTLTWRMIASLTTSAIVFVITGNLALSAGAGLVDALIKLFFYYFHERVWNRVTWGRNI
ncbi:MAG TPA: DUF2061 domain-containing protein [archaeon]|nr:DUF2061 domain-containing protein [archaeon]